MKIHELNTFSGTPKETDYFAIDGGGETTKVTVDNFVDSSVDTTFTEIGWTKGTLNKISSMLKFIGTKIADAQAPTVTTVSDRNEKCTSGVCFLTYDKLSKLVRVHFYAATDGTSNLGIDDAIFTLPQAYRPSAQKNGSCICWNPTSKEIYVSQLQVKPTGELWQRAISNCSRVFAFVEYKL